MAGNPHRGVRRQAPGKKAAARQGMRAAVNSERANGHRKGKPKRIGFAVTRSRDLLRRIVREHASDDARQQLADRVVRASRLEQSGFEVAAGSACPVPAWGRGRLSRTGRPLSPAVERKRAGPGSPARPRRGTRVCSGLRGQRLAVAVVFRLAEDGAAERLDMLSGSIHQETEPAAMLFSVFISVRSGL